jgi:MFS family permease
MSKVGYYAGLIVRGTHLFTPLHPMTIAQDTTFFLTEAVFVLQWSRISDRIGRRPILLIGVTGLTLSSICFGLSTSFPGLIFSRALAGVLNANFAVLRGAMAEILDPSNFARGIAFVPIMWRCE